MLTVKIIKDWESPNLLRQTPNSLGIWNNVKFILETNLDSDYIIVLNKIDLDLSVFISIENVWAVMQEPYIKGIHEWMVNKHGQFSRVYTHFIFNKKDKYKVSQPLLPWHIEKTYDDLVNMEIPIKNQLISCISSNKSQFPGHILRVNFIRNLINSKIDIKLFGRGFNYLNDKFDGLSSFKYSIVIENSSSSNYWTEKISDCFLSYTMPFYYGCTNINDYFPENSLIKIDINNFQKSIEIIEEAIASELWEKNIDSIVFSRNKILNEYQFFPFIANEISKHNKLTSSKKRIKLKKYSNCKLRYYLSKFV